MTATLKFSRRVSLSRLTEPKALQRVGGVLAHAFAVDPVLRFSMPVAHVRARVLPMLYEQICRLAVRIGGVEMLGGQAGAVWLEGRTEAPTLLAIRLGFLRVLCAMGPRSLLRLLRHEHACAARVRAVGLRSYGYIWLLGVSPEAQGQGFGMAALKQAEGTLFQRGHHVCLLKTETEGNVDFYKRAGFSCIDTAVIRSSGIRYWLMQKELTGPS